jgi:ATP-dependent RNA helicase DDX60
VVDFSLILATIVTSLNNFVSPSRHHDDVSDMINLQGSGDSHENALADRNDGGARTGDESESGPDDEDDGQDNDHDDATGVPAWDREDGGSLLKVLQTFQMLKEAFDGKFKAMWA